MFEENNSDFYDWSYYESLERRYNSGAQKNKLITLFRLLGNVRGKRILDLGCGGGFFAAECQKRGAEVIAVDYAKDAIAFARDRFPSLDSRVASAYTLSEFTENQFDIILLIDVIEHVSDQEAVLSGIQRILKPKGLLVISTDLEDSIWNREWMKSPIWFSLRFSKAGKVYLRIKKEEAMNIQRTNYHASHIGLLTFPEMLKLLQSHAFSVRKHIVYPLVRVPIRDIVFQFLPKNWRGDHQMIVAENTKD